MSEYEQLVLPPDNVQIGVRGWSREPGAEAYWPVSAGIGPLLHVYKRSPKVQLTFDGSRFWLGEVFRVRENETRWPSLQEVIQEAEIFSVNSYADAHMTLWVKGAQLSGYFRHP